MAVSLSALGGAGWQFLTDNGVILSGGLINTYEAGTSTPAATYTDSSGGTAHANPIILDAFGRPPGEIWVNSLVNYKFVVTTSTGTESEDYDDIYGITSALDVPPVVASYAALSALTGMTTGSLARVSAGTGIDGLFRYDSTQSGTDNSGTIIDGWVRQYFDKFNVEFFGALGDGSTADRTAIQLCFTAISDAGGGHILFPDSAGDWPIAGSLDFANAVNTTIEFSPDSGYLKLTSATAAGGIVTSAASSTIEWLNPKIDANSILGQNGIEPSSTGCTITVEGGHLKNFPVAGDYTGGKPIAIDGSGCTMFVNGTRISDSHSGINLKRDLTADSGTTPLIAVISDVVFENCDILMYTGIKNSTTNDGTLFDVSLTNFNALDCGSLGGVFLFDRASNVKITSGSISATSTYNSSTAVEAIFRGRGRKLVIDDIQINQDADAIIDIDPLANYAIDTSLMADNNYKFTATGTYDYVFFSDITDSTYANRFLDNTYIDAQMTNDVGTAIVSPATRNGSTMLTIRNNLKVMFQLASTFNSTYTNIAAIPLAYYYQPTTGSWTPIISGTGGSAATAAYTSFGAYTLIGDEYTITGWVKLTNVGSWTGNVQITGLPEASDGTDSYGVVKISTVTAPANAVGITAQLGEASFSQMRFDWNISGGAFVKLDWATHMAATSQIYFSMSYPR